MINIATALNKKYVPYTAVMLSSLCTNNKESVRAFLLHSELEQTDIKLLQTILQQFDIEIVFLKIDSNLFDARILTTDLWSIEAYYRLLLLDILPEGIERLLYLDVDIIVNGSLEEFYRLDFKENEIIATEDACGFQSVEDYSDKQKEMFAPMFALGYRYFNSGVMLLNIAQMRKKYSFHTYLDAIEEWNFQMTAPDQDILNYVHWQRVVYVDPLRYDLFSHRAHHMKMTYEQVKNEAVIVHYTAEKPWDGAGIHYDIEQLWWDYAKNTTIYMELLEAFMRSAIQSSATEKLIIDLNSQLELAMNVNERLMAMLQKTS